jgi:hypothetical protein
LSYNPNIPQLTDKILQSQPQLKANFQTINTSFSDNHISPTNSTNTVGMHSVLTMRPQGGDPATGANQVALYNKLVSSIPEIFFRPQNNATPIQLTFPSIGVATSPPYPSDQYTFMAGPFIVYGGLITNAANGQVKVLTPGTTLLYVGLTTANYVVGGGGSGVIAAATPTNIAGTSFTITFQNVSVTSKRDVYYLAIGI